MKQSAIYVNECYFLIEWASGQDSHSGDLLQFGSLHNTNIYLCATVW